MENVAAVASPETSPDLFPTNEPLPDPNTTPENSVIEKIKRAGKGVFEKHGVVFKRGGGRPRKDGAPNKLDVPLNAPATALPVNSVTGSAPVAPALDSALVQRCFKAVIRGVSGFMDKLLYRRALQKTGNPQTAQQLVADTSITKEEADSFSELGEILLRQYGVDTKHAPAIAVGFLLVGIGSRWGLAMKAMAPDEQPETTAPAKHGEPVQL